jgi:uncharacterized protein YecE (DUF72 family)
MPAAGQMLYFRLHGRRFNKWWNHEHRNERYDYIYSAEELRTFADRIRARLERGLHRAYTFFNNHPGAKAVANAIMLRAELDAPVESELPERLVAHFPELKGGAGA